MKGISVFTLSIPQYQFFFIMSFLLIFTQTTSKDNEVHVTEKNKVGI